MLSCQLTFGLRVDWDREQPPVTHELLSFGTGKCAPWNVTLENIQKEKNLNISKFGLTVFCPLTADRWSIVYNI